MPTIKFRYTDTDGHRWIDCNEGEAIINLWAGHKVQEYYVYHDEEVILNTRQAKNIDAQLRLCLATEQQKEER